jgi:hypothetical protein
MAAMAYPAKAVPEGLEDPVALAKEDSAGAGAAEEVAVEEADVGAALRAEGKAWPLFGARSE